jgi:hypothetical protein
VAWKSASVYSYGSVCNSYAAECVRERVWTVAGEDDVKCRSESIYEDRKKEANSYIIHMA